MSSSLGNAKGEDQEGAGAALCENLKADPPKLFGPPHTVGKWLDLSDAPQVEPFEAKRRLAARWSLGASLVPLPGMVMAYFVYPPAVPAFLLVPIALYAINTLHGGGKRVYLRGFPANSTTVRVRMEILRNGYVTGVDWGYLWIENGILYFTGRLSSFALPKTRLSRSLNPSRWMERAGENSTNTFRYGLACDIDGVELRIKPVDFANQAEGAEFDIAVRHPDATPPTDESVQLPPLTLGPTIDTFVPPNPLFFAAGWISFLVLLSTETRFALLGYGIVFFVFLLMAVGRARFLNRLKIHSELSKSTKR